MKFYVEPIGGKTGLLQLLSWYSFEDVFSLISSEIFIRLYGLCC